MEKQCSQERQKSRYFESMFPLKKSKFLAPPKLRRLPCNAFIVPSYDNKLKLQKAQNKRIWLCMDLPPRCCIDAL